MKKSLIILLSLTLFYSCKQSEEKKNVTEDTTVVETVNVLSPDSLKTRVTLLKDSMDATWGKLINTDNQKFADIKRLLQEVTYTKSYDPTKVDALIAMTDSVKALQYTQDGMTSSQIDEYDKATEDLVKKTFLLVNNNAEMAGHSITEPLKNDIMKGESKLVNNRILYDRWAKEYNAHIEKDRQILQQFGEPYSTYEKKPIFELSS